MRYTILPLCHTTPKYATWHECSWFSHIPNNYLYFWIHQLSVINLVKKFVIFTNLQCNWYKVKKQMSWKRFFPWERGILTKFCHSRFSDSQVETTELVGRETDIYTQIRRDINRNEISIMGLIDAKLTAVHLKYGSMCRNKWNMRLKRISCLQGF